MIKMNEKNNKTCEKCKTNSVDDNLERNLCWECNLEVSYQQQQEKIKKVDK